MRKKLLFLSFLILAACLEALLFRGNSLVEKARGEDDSKKKIEILMKEQDFYPLNDRLYADLGKAFFDAAVNRLQDAERRDVDLKSADRYFRLSLTLNPLSAKAHFDFAQALQYLNFSDVPASGSPYQEYVKAARLSGRNAQIFYEVGKILFSRWPSLSPEEKRYTQDILRDIFTDRDEDKLIELLNLWTLNVLDYGVIQKILPAHEASYRLFAQFLAEHSLSKEERLNYLIQAEAMDFSKAKAEFLLAHSEFQAFKIKEAEAHFRESLNSLQKIKFYQNLTSIPPTDLIFPETGRSYSIRFHRNFSAAEYHSLKKSLYLGLAECRVENTRKLEESMEDLRAYLRLEDNAAAVGGLEQFLKERGLIEDKLTTNMKDLSRFSFDLGLYFKQNRYRDIVDVGQALEHNFLLIPESGKKEYAEVLEIIGDSYQKLDYLYESNGFYQKALDIAGSELGILAKMRKNFERLNNAQQVSLIDAQIPKLLSPREFDFESTIIPKGTNFSQALTLDGKNIRLSLAFTQDEGEPYPYVAVFFNGQVVWEDFVRDPALTIRLQTDLGANALEILPLNKPVTLLKLSIFSGEAEELIISP